MPAIVHQTLPETALLQSYHAAGAHTDCYTVEVPGEVTLEAYLTAFYTSWAFRPERVLLGLLLGKRAGAAEVAALAAGQTERFSAWSVEARAVDQILLCDYQHRTRSWLMVAPGSVPGTTLLHFGSAVTRTGRTRAARLGEAALFNGLLWFHAAYSRVLLWAAVRALR
jgi:hypothetical protein